MSEASPVADEVVDAPPAISKEVALATIRTTALSELSAVELGIASLREQHGATDYDITTPKGYKLATERRHAIRLVRYKVPHVVKARKQEMKEIGEAVGTEGDRIIAALKEIEDPHDLAIESEDARKAAEAQRLKDIEDARKAAHRARITAIYQCATKAQGLPSARIANGIAAVDALVTDEATYQEFAREAADAKAETLATMRALFATTKAAEDAAAAQEAQRVEQARVAEEQRAEAARLDQARAMIAKAEREAAEKIEADRAQLAKEKAEWLAKQAAAAPAPAQAEAPAPAAALTIVAPLPEVKSTPITIPAAAPAAALPPAVGTLNVGAICRRFGNGLTMTAAFIEQELGVTPATTDKAAKLFTEAQFRVICDRLMVLAGRVRSGEVETA